MSITIVGLLAGTGISLALVTYLSSFLYGVTTGDALTFVSVPLVVVAVAANGMCTASAPGGPDRSVAGHARPLANEVNVQLTPMRFVKPETDVRRERLE